MLILSIVSVLMQAAPVVAAPVTDRAGRGTVTVTLRDADPVRDAAGEPVDDDPFVQATRNALSNADFVVLPAGDHGRYVATVVVTRQQRGVVTANGVEDKPSADVGNWGGGVRVTLPSRKTGLHGLVVTEMHIEMRRRSDQGLVWSGSALTAQVDGTSAGSPRAVGTKLANRIVAQFPVTVNGPISVP
jgi:hypothetical protein